MRVVVAGGGLAGLTAARRALELGARVTLLEKGDRLGGSFVYSSGYVWSYKDLRTYRREAPGGNVALQRLILERLEGDIGWLEKAGVRVTARETGNPLTFGVRFEPGPVIDGLVAGIVDRGGEVSLNTPLTGLHTSLEGRVTGVRASAEGRGRTVGADAVILASGGYAANPELVARGIIRGPGRMRLRTHPWSTGDGFLAALDAGGLASDGLDEFYGRNLPAPPADFPPEKFVEVSQLYGRHAVAINSDGFRYADESADWSETALTRATARQPGLRAWYVLDTEGLRERVRERTVEEMVEAARRFGGTVIQAGSLKELADRLAKRGLPQNNVRHTLESYNTAVGEGSPGELSPPRSDPAPRIQAPPFVAVEVAASITHTIGGLAVDGGCRVLRAADERPIPGLYAAGVEVGGVSTGGYTSGLASALVFGLTAAESAVEDASSGLRKD